MYLSRVVRLLLHGVCLPQPVCRLGHSVGSRTRTRSECILKSLTLQESGVMEGEKEAQHEGREGERDGGRFELEGGHTQIV